MVRTKRRCLLNSAPNLNPDLSNDFLICYFSIVALSLLFPSCKYIFQIRTYIVVMIGEGNGNPLQDPCLENPIGGGAWWAAVHGVVKSRTQLSNFPFTFHFHALEKEMSTHSSVLARRIPGTGSLVGCHLWGRTESDTTEVT